MGPYYQPILRHGAVGAKIPLNLDIWKALKMRAIELIDDEAKIFVDKSHDQIVFTIIVAAPLPRKHSDDLPL